MKQGAILVIGQLRCWGLNSKEFARLADKFDIFLITERAWAPVIDDDRYKVYFIDDDPAEVDRHNVLKNYSEKQGRKMLQWSKLAFGLRKLIEYETLNDSRYSVLIKLRTDLQNIRDINFDRDFEDDWLYCESDYCFAAKRDTFLKLSEFCQSPEKYYNWFTPIDTSLIGFAKSDFAAARFIYLVYPAILKFVPWWLLQAILRLRVKWPSKSGFSLKKNWNQVGFASEPSFLRHALERGLSIARIGQTEITLVADRRLEKPPQPRSV